MRRGTMALAMIAVVAVPRVALAATKEESQVEVREAAQEALAAVYKVQPSARKAAEELNKFVNSGWEIGGQATASAKSGDKGASYQGAVSVAPGVWLNQVSGDSLALELTAKGTKYYKDKI